MNDRIRHSAVGANDQALHVHTFFRVRIADLRILGHGEAQVVRHRAAPLDRPRDGASVADGNYVVIVLPEGQAREREQKCENQYLLRYPAHTCPLPYLASTARSTRPGQRFGRPSSTARTDRFPISGKNAEQDLRTASARRW